MTTANPNPGTGTDARAAGIVLISIALLSIVAMAHHPTAETHDSAALAAEIAGKAWLSRLVHGVLIAFMAAQLWGFAVFSRRIEVERIGALAGFIAYALGTGAMIGAALISGFVVSDLGAHYAQRPDAALFVDLARLCMTGNQALARLGVVAMSAAIVLWSLALVRVNRSHLWLAVVGLVVGLGPALALLAGAIRLDVGGMTLVVVCQAVWTIGVGVQLIRGKI